MCWRTSFTPSWTWNRLPSSIPSITSATTLRPSCRAAKTVPDMASGAPRLDHVGFVVSSIEKSLPGFVQSLGGKWDGTVFDDPHQKVRVTFLEVRHGDSRIELIEPNAEDAPVSGFLTAKGGGLHHLCYEVDDLDAELASARSRGARIAKRPHPAVAFDGRRIAWIITAE